MATFLADNGIQVSVENPAQIYAFGQSALSRNKADQGDAKLIARYCALHMPAPWTPAPLSEHQLTALVKHLGNLEKLKQMQENRQLVAEAYWRMSVICQNSVVARNWWLTQGLIQNGSCSPQESVIYACPDSTLSCNVIVKAQWERLVSRHRRWQGWHLCGYA